jgi:hypothetical protein
MAELIQSPSSRLLMLGAGKFLINEWDNTGAPTYYRAMGNIGSGELSQTQTRLVVRESMTRNRDVYLDLPKDQTFQLRLALDEWSTRNVGLYLKGTVTQTPAQVATPIVDEAVTTDATLGAVYFPAKFGPFTAFSAKTGSTVLTLGTDYTVDLETGLITLLTTAVDISDGDPLSVSYTPTAYPTGVTQVKAGRRDTLRASIMFIGDPQNGPRYKYIFHKCTVAPDANMALISPPDATTTAPLTLVASVESDLVNHPDSPLFDQFLIGQQG